MTVEDGTVVTGAPAAPPVGVREPAAAAPARWRTRAAALAVDLLPGGAVAVAMGLLAVALPLASPWWWVCAVAGGAAVLLMAANRVLLPAVTGRSLGRAAVGIAVSGQDGQPVSAARLLLRDLAHLLDTASACVGWLWPLWDDRGRTFADLLAHTEVRQDPAARPRNAFGPATLVAGAAALTCVAAAALGYFAVYRPERASDTARTQLAERGPRIVEQLLSYDPQSLADDFARAQSLATAHYREQLVPQQEAVQRGKPVPNTYRAINAAMLSATPRHSTMLLFLQGERGRQNAERLITATVRVDFAKVAGSWLVDDLTVVTKPPAGGTASEDGK